MKCLLSFICAFALLCGWIPADAEDADCFQYVFFGHYPQTAGGKDSTPIEWLVLDTEDDRVLLLSRYGLDREPYNTTKDDVVWETCSLRTWLNETFLNRAFTAEEAESILVTECINEDVDWNAVAKAERREPYSIDKNISCSNTQDRIFALSIAEAGKYFHTQEARICAPTDYAVKRGAWAKPGIKDSSRRAAGDWWLRSGGTTGVRAADVYYNGVRRDHEVHYPALCVRPAMWVKRDILKH